MPAANLEAKLPKLKTAKILRGGDCPCGDGRIRPSAERSEAGFDLDLGFDYPGTAALG
jgi:hypothetical protein